VTAGKGWMQDEKQFMNAEPPSGQPATEAAAAATLKGGLLARLERAGEDYRLTRFVLLRLTGLVWFAAFLSAALQFIPLVGHDGLLPADLFVRRVVAS